MKLLFDQAFLQFFILICFFFAFQFLKINLVLQTLSNFETFFKVYLVLFHNTSFVKYIFLDWMKNFVDI